MKSPFHALLSSKLFKSLCGDHAALGKINSKHIMTTESKKTTKYNRLRKKRFLHFQIHFAPDDAEAANVRHT